MLRQTLRPTSRGKLIGNHESIRKVVATIERAARSNCTVLITGESGTGKELVAAALHDASHRSANPLVVVNCGAIPENLLESELFGHARGAFTGAYTARQGRVAAAEGGTLFLDEIGELPLPLQVKLLRLLQQREYSPVGETRVFRSDIRVVAATNRDLEREVASGRFREDLYYRLNVMHVHLPALRERIGDIELLAKHFLEAYKDRLGRPDLLGFTEEALQVLRANDWPGNIRALENAVECAVVLAQGPWIEVHDLPPKVRERESSVFARPAAFASVQIPDQGIDFRATVEAFENELIRQALAKTGNNKNRAAQLLGIHRTTLVEMLKRKGL